MALSKTGFRRVAGAAFIGLTTVLAGCASNPHEQGEARGLQAGAVTYGIGKLAGLSDGDAAAVGGLVGLGVGAIAESNEPDCYSVLGANHGTLTQNGYTQVRTIANEQFLCKPEAVDRATVRSMSAPIQTPGTRANITSRPYGHQRQIISSGPRGFRYTN